MVSYISRKNIFDSIPERYETVEGKKFKINKYQGENEMPEAKIPFLILMWGLASNGKRFVNDYLGMARITDVTNSNTTQETIETIRNGEYIEFIVYPSTKLINTISVYTKTRTEETRAKLFVYRLNKDNEWQLIHQSYIFDFSIQIEAFTDFPVGIFVKEGEPIKFRLQNWSFNNAGKIDIPVRLVTSEFGFEQKIPIYNLVGSIRSLPRFGQLERLSLDIRLGIGDLGLLGGPNYIPSRIQVKTIYDTLLPQILQKWTALVEGGYVRQVGTLIRVSGGIKEEGQWNFTVEFEYENSNVIKEPRYPIAQIRKKRVYLKE